MGRRHRHLRRVRGQGRAWPCPSVTVTCGLHSSPMIGATFTWPTCVRTKLPFGVFVGELKLQGRGRRCCIPAAPHLAVALGLVLVTRCVVAFLQLQESGMNEHRALPGRMFVWRMLALCRTWRCTCCVG